MKEKPSNYWEKGTEEMIEWRSMSQKEMDRRWKELAEKLRKRFWTSTRWKTASEVLTEAEVLLWNGGVCETAGSTEYESGEKIVGQESSLCSENTTCSVCKACMRSRRKKKR